MKNYFSLFFLWLVLLTACQGSVDSEMARSASEEASFPPAPTLSAPEVARGQQVYAENCASACHGANLEGEAEWKSQNEDGSFRAPPHDATGHTWHHSDELLLEAIRLGGARLPDNIGGTSNMPAFADALSDEEILAVLSYIKSSWPEEIRQVQWEATIGVQADTQ